MAKETEKIVLSNPYNEKMVKIKLFKDGDKYKDDVFVGRNGMSYLIQRGVEVEVPEGIAKILMQSQEMDEATAAKIAEAQSKAKKAE